MDIRSLTYSHFLKRKEGRRFLPDEWSERRVLDVACGTGDNQRFFGEYVGVDLLPPGLGRPDFPFIQADAGRLPIHDDAVDHFFCNSLLEHLEDPGPVLREMHRVARGGGMIGVPVLDAFPFLYDPVNWIRKRLGKGPVNFGIGGFGHIHMHYSADWERMFREAGFEVVKTNPESTLDFFSVLEFLVLSIPFSSMEYVGFVRKAKSTPGRFPRIAAAIVTPVYRLLFALNFRIKGSVSYYYLLAKPAAGPSEA